MKGLPVMVVVSVFIGAVSAGGLGWIGGVIVSLVVFIAWFRFNLKTGTIGRFKANLNSYFAFRQKGLSVDEALRAELWPQHDIHLPTSKRRKKWLFSS